MTSHVWHKCSGDCIADPCMFCDGGLKFCEVCKGGEVELPTECPGRPMSEDEREAVSAGLLDYRDGRWVGEAEIMSLGDP